MDKFISSAYDTYFKTLENLGYVNGKNVSSLLVLDFFYHLLVDDYRGYVSKEDYNTIEQALECLYGTNCLIPYPDYLKMGKLRLGEMTELASRTANLETYSKELSDRISDNDVLIADNNLRIEKHGVRLDEHERHLKDHDAHLAAHDTTLSVHEGRLDSHDNTLANHTGRIETLEGTVASHGQRLDNHDTTLTAHGNRISTLEGTYAMQNNAQITEIDPIDFDEVLQQNG